MRCILHIGTEKTGSTTLQHTLRENRPLLSENGIFFSVAAGNQLSRELAECFIPFDEDSDFTRKRGLIDPDSHSHWCAEKLDEVRGEIDRIRSQFDSYILSCEHFSSRLLTQEAVTALGSFLGAQFSEIRVVCYLRRQDLMAVSRFNENLKAGFTNTELTTVNPLAPLPRLFDYASLIERWSNTFGRDAIQIRVVEPERLVNANVVDDFVRNALNDTLVLPVKSPANASLSAVAQLALKLFNVTVGPEHRAAMAGTRRELTRFLIARSSGPAHLPSRDNATSFYHHFKPGNDSIARKYLNQDSLFSETFNHYPTRSDAAPPVAEAASLLSKFFVDQFEQRLD